MVKRIWLFILTVFIICEISAQSKGVLTVTTTTSNAGGNYAPKNIVAIWIENGNGKFVKTLAAYANVRKAYLNTWKTSTTNAGIAYNTVDAITGATRPSHGTITCSWNGTDYNGAEVANGTYNIRFELTDKHSTGNLASYSFSKGNVSQELKPTDVPSFKSTSIKWEPASQVGTVEISKPNGVDITFDSSSEQLLVIGVPVKKVEVYNYAGQLVLTSSSSISNLNSLPDGVYLIVIKSDTKIYSKKIMKFKQYN
jgi:hypothetical protein